MSRSNNYYSGGYSKDIQKDKNQTRKSGNRKDIVEGHRSECLYEIPGDIPDLVDLYKDHHKVPNKRKNNNGNRTSSKEEKKQEAQEDSFLPKNIVIPGPIPDIPSLYREGLSDSLYYLPRH